MKESTDAKGMDINMKLVPKDMLLYVVTDRTWLGSSTLIQQVEDIIKSGATLLQLREKSMEYDEFVNEAVKLKEITNFYGIPLIINDNIEVAIAAGADGVHLGQNDGDLRTAKERLGYDKIIGSSVHNVEEAMLAEKNGADYIGVGAVFNTSTKKNTQSISYATLQQICSSVSIPVVAIGGITKENVSKLSGSGVDGIAVISAIFSEPDIGKATRNLLELSKQIVGITA